MGALLLAAALLASCSAGADTGGTGANEPPPGSPTGDPTATSPAPGSAGGPSDASTETTGSPAPHYVALGDSYTAAPYVPRTDLAGGCLRSDGNYPSLVAANLPGTELHDVSCGGARTGDLRKPQTTVPNHTVPAQLDALTDGTDLVTLGIGGNDLSLFGTLVRTCVPLRADDPQGAPCRARLERRGVDLGRRIDRVGDRVGRVLATIHARAPGARVLVVGYPRLAPPRGTCPDLLPLAAGDYALARTFARRLNHVLATAARGHDAGFVDVYAASRGHDICSDQPWVNGRRTDTDRAAAYHPFPVEQRAVADLILQRLR